MMESPSQKNQGYLSLSLANTQVPFSGDKSRIYDMGLTHLHHKCLDCILSKEVHRFTQAREDLNQSLKKACVSTFPKNCKAEILPTKPKKSFEWLRLNKMIFTFHVH